MPDPAPSDDAAALEVELRDLLRRARELGPDALAALHRVVAESVADADASAAAPATSAAPAGEEWQGMWFACPAMQRVRELVQKYAPAAVPVLIHGESGTGKDLVARALHALSPRARHTLVSENCAAIPETLLESTLFGHTRGAFTGAVRDHEGHFVAAHKGTLFLDEIGDMPLSMQAKLLRVLQEGEVRAVGGTKVRKVDVRVVAATHQDLEAMVREGSFREDLFYRLNVLRLELPPLRERGRDALGLAERLLASAAAANGRELRLGADAAELVLRSRWPGNIRQLMNEIQRVAALADGPEVRADDFSPELQRSAQG